MKEHLVSQLSKVDVKEAIELMQSIITSYFNTTIK